MDDNQRHLWIAMSDLWLDTELTNGAIQEVAKVVQESGRSRVELEEIFRFELAPFLDRNLRTVAGVWAGFDPDWVCQQASKQRGKRRTISRIAALFSWRPCAARPAWERVLELVFPDPAR